MRQYVRMMALAGMAMLLTAGCATTQPRWPAISDTPTDVHIQGRWVWVELFADNEGTEKTFYQEIGKLLIPTQDWGGHFLGYREQRRPMPVAVVYGWHDVLPFCAGSQWTVPCQV